MSLEFTNQPPASRIPYAIPQLEGERITIPGSKGVFRILTSAKQTGGLMAVFTSGAVLSDAPGFHYHDRAHDVFLVTKGFLKLYNGDQCRIMGPGDFAYVPPVCERIIERGKKLRRMLIS
jgi:quercetin dioxygenase-like cupin family protein